MWPCPWGFHLWTHLLLGCCVMTWPDWTGDSVWAWWMLWTIAVTSRFSWTIDVSQTLQRPCWNCLHASGICRCSPILSTAKLCKNNITSDIVNLLKIGQNSAPSFTSSLKPLNNYLQYDRDRKHHIPQINVFTNKIHSIFTKQFACTPCYKLCYTSILNASYSIMHFVANTFTLMMTKL